MLHLSKEKIKDAIIEAAMIKFGQVYGYSEDTYGSLRLCIERSNPVFKDLPFMTITGKHTGEGVDFFIGHYDLTEKQALEGITNIFDDAY